MKRISAVIAAAAAAALSLSACSTGTSGGGDADFPTKDITLIVQAAAGGGI